VHRFDTVFDKILIEEKIKIVTPAEIVTGVPPVDSQSCSKTLLIEVAGSEKMVVGIHDPVDTAERMVKGGGTIDPKDVTSQGNPEGGVLKTEGWLRTEHGDAVRYFGFGDPIISGDFGGGEKIFLGSTAERTPLRISAYHIIAANSTDVLFLHRVPVYDVLLPKKSKPYASKLFVSVRPKYVFQNGIRIAAA